MTARVGRLRRMQPGELRFRAACELRKLADRAAVRVSAARWNRRALIRRLAPDGAASAEWRTAIGSLRRHDEREAHLALSAHFARRASPFPLNAADRPALSTLIARRFPAAAADAVDRADAILEGRYSLLGHRRLQVGAPPDWHRDPVHGRSAPLGFWGSLAYLDPVNGDHKIIWELNRHQHWLTLGRAFALSGAPRFHDEFVAQLAGWLAANPPLRGMNWASMLELAFRTLSWLWALELFAGAAGAADHDPWTIDLLLGADRQLTHIERNLSRYFSPNTHLTGEALALYVSGQALPELRASARRLALGRRVLVEEIARQILDDGGHAERSMHYHRYSTDFYLLALAVARRAGDPAAQAFEDAARRQACFLRTMVDEAGLRPAIGDDDGGQLFPIGGRPAADCRDTLATAAVLLGEPGLALGGIPEETCWMCGERALALQSAPPASWRSAVFRTSGYVVSRTTRGDHLVFDAGPLGYLNCGHAHADALSCTLAIGGRPLLIDPGTATYTMSAEMRERFRSTRMHNTAVLDGRPQSEPRGPFHWSTRTDARLSYTALSDACDYGEGTHDGYSPRRHTRALVAIHGVGWFIVDHVLGRDSACVEHSWHVHPSWRCEVESAGTCRFVSGAARTALASSVPITLLQPGTHPLAQWSPDYGCVEPAPVLLAEWQVPLPASAGTFVAAVPALADRLSVEAIPLTSRPGPDWHGAAFRVRWRDGRLTVLSAVQTPGVEADGRPGPARWGTDDLQTDARAALLLDAENGGTEAVLVAGTVLTSGAGDAFVSLPERTAVCRLRVRELAPGVHAPAGRAPALP